MGRGLSHVSFLLPSPSGLVGRGVRWDCGDEGGPCMWWGRGGEGET